jgi:hypothetical protein
MWIVRLALRRPCAHAYDLAAYVLAGFLVVGLVCNASVGPVAKKWQMTEGEVAQLRASGRSKGRGATTHSASAKWG